MCFQDLKIPANVNEAQVGGNCGSASSLALAKEGVFIPLICRPRYEFSEHDFFNSQPVNDVDVYLLRSCRGLSKIGRMQMQSRF